MPLAARLRMTAAEAAAAIASGTLNGQLEQSISLGGGHVSESERRSWAHSIPVVVNSLIRGGLSDTVMLFELKMPLSHRRADITLVGQHPDGRPSVVVVENKQWSAVSADPDGARVIVGGLGSQTHPLSQVYGYIRQLRNYVPWVAGAHLLGGVNLHNASDEDLVVLQGIKVEADATRECRLFGMAGQSQLDAFLSVNLVAQGDAAGFADEFLGAETTPTPRLMQAVVTAVRHQTAFALQDEQRAAFDVVMAALRRAGEGDHKEAVLIVGGPGTGKSVIAVELLGALSRSGDSAVYATGSKSFTTTLRRLVGGRDAKDAFVYFDSFTDTRRNSLKVVICDEAHRIRSTSSSRFRRSSGQAQIDELLSVAAVPVFLLDDDQAVRRGEVGSIQLIREACARRGIQLHEIVLRDQFRCAGSETYLDWVDRLLGISGEQPGPWDRRDAFQLSLAPDPETLERAIVHRNAGIEQSARMMAGFCWPWSDPQPDGTLVPDVVIGSWARPWNANTDRIRGDYPPSQLWATDPRGIGQVGCIYTAQGFEFAHAGVIMGGDLVWRTDHWVGVPEASHDRGAKGEDFTRNVRNSYRVLLTRGLEGAVLHSTDAETMTFLESLGLPHTL